MREIKSYKGWKYQPYQPVGNYGVNWRIDSKKAVVTRPDSSKVLRIDINGPDQDKLIERFKTKVDELTARYPNLTPS